MLRRRLHTAISVQPRLTWRSHGCVQRSTRNSTSGCLCGSSSVFIAIRTGFFSKKPPPSTSADAPGGADGAGPAGFPPSFDPQRLRLMQEMLQNQPPEKQAQLIQQAMEFQKTMGKIPGLGKMMERNAAMMAQVMKNMPPPPKSDEKPLSGTSAGNTAGNRDQMFTASPTASGASSGSTNRNEKSTCSNTNRPTSGRGGPTLDELRTVNLGPEIEELFTELRTIRAKKNEYRDKLTAAQVALDGVTAEKESLAATEANLRGRLKKAEQDVMLVTSENMELREQAKQVKQLTAANQQLTRELRTLKAQASASHGVGSPSYEALQQQLHAKDTALRSLQRKVDRLRRRDPLLQFSLACSDLSRLCNDGHDPGKEAADDAFAALQSRYQELQHDAWERAASENGAAAKAYIAAAARYIVSCVPHANYDAMILVNGDVAAAARAFEASGFTVERGAGGGEEGRCVICASPTAAPQTVQLGPYGYAVALKAAGESAPFSITSVHPFVSSTLMANTQRCEVRYETARASGPGGQATNVSETQIYAKLFIDGEAAFTAESQDSRSALSNKETALEKLHGTRREQWNDTLAKQQRYEELHKALVAAIAERGGLAVESEVAHYVRDAQSASMITSLDATLAACVQRLGEESSKTA